MESYKANGRSSYGRSMNNNCNQGKQMNSYGRQMSMSRSQMSSSDRQMNSFDKQMSNRDSDCSDMRILPISEKNDSNCKENNHHMRHMHLAIGYVPIHEWGDLYDLETAHCQGTIFPELNLVFCGGRGKM